MADKFEPVKRSHEGLLHKKMGVPEGKPISDAALHHEMDVAKRTGNTKLEREVNFAEVERHWRHVGHH